MKQLKNRKPMVIAILVLVLAVVGIVGYINSPSFWSTRLVGVIREGDSQKVALLIDEGIQKGYSMDTPTHDSAFLRLMEYYPEVPLPLACQKGDVEIAQMLLKAGASPNQNNNPGWSPLSATVLGHFEEEELQLVELLLSYSADPAEEDGGSYPILRAVQRIPSVYLGKPDPDTGFYYEEEYDASIGQGITEVFCLMAQYTDCQIKDSVGRNALHYAAIYENYALAEYLLNELGFDPNERDVNGNTPAELAYERGYTELAELIDNKSQP